MKQKESRNEISMFQKRRSLVSDLCDKILASDSGIFLKTWTKVENEIFSKKRGYYQAKFY